MRYIIAYDGGGTKTQIGLFDEHGHLLFQKIGAGCNHASSDGHLFKSVIEQLFLDALSVVKFKKSDINYVFLGLSGADVEADFIKLNQACTEIFGDIPFKIVNDAWIIMRSGLKSPFGAVAICGTGTNSAAIGKKGKKAILRSLGFTLGIYGGGLDIAREALHYAFRSEELTYKKTILETEIPKLLQCKDMNEIVDLFYPSTKVTKKQFGEITALVHQYAVLGDEVCQEILIKMGKYIGEQTAGVIKQVDIQDLEVPVVIGGRVFSGVSPLLIEEFIKNLLISCPKAYLIKPKYKPVVGAFLSALDELDIDQSLEVEKNLDGGIDI